MPLRGIRGATTAAENSVDAIGAATTELLNELSSRNHIDPAEIALAYFTTTTDLDAEYPALAARRMGWVQVPLLCGNDMVVAAPNPRAVPRCIRILLLYNTERSQSDMRSAYLRGAEVILADLESSRLESMRLELEQ
ncbi:MAG: chorismate mutase [Candidatus Dormibacteraeota bacterium]|nr:chorismate mutase [Candidatus Dormibacteraeota bacterium]